MEVIEQTELAHLNTVKSKSKVRPGRDRRSPEQRWDNCFRVSSCWRTCYSVDGWTTGDMKASA